MTKSLDRRPAPFTTEQDAILRRLYPGKGYRACLAALPDRSPSSIENRARSLGLPGPKGRLSPAALESRRRNLAKAHAAKNVNPERAERICLGVCGEMFVSEHKYNRMCKSCRGYAERVGFDTVGVGV